MTLHVLSICQNIYNYILFVQYFLQWLLYAPPNWISLQVSCGIGDCQFVVLLNIQLNMSKPNILMTIFCVCNRWFIHVKLTKISYIGTLFNVRFIQDSSLFSLDTVPWFVMFRQSCVSGWYSIHICGGWGQLGRDSTIVGFTTTCAISAYHHYSCEFKSCSWWGVLDTTLCDKASQWLATGRWFYPGTPVSSINKTDRHKITEILLKVALNTITHPTHLWSL